MRVFADDHTSLNELLTLRPINKKVNNAVINMIKSIVECHDLSHKNSVSFKTKLCSDLLFINRHYNYAVCPRYPIMPKIDPLDPRDQNNEILHIILDETPLLFNLHSKDKMDFLLKQNNETEEVIIRSTTASNYIFFQYLMDEGGIKKATEWNRNNQHIYQASKNNSIFFLVSANSGYSTKLDKVFPKRVGINYFYPYGRVRVPDFVFDSFDDKGTYIFCYIDEKENDYTCISLYIGFFVNNHISRKVMSDVMQWFEGFNDSKNELNAWASTILNLVKNNIESKKIITRIHLFDCFFSKNPSCKASKFFFNCTYEAFTGYAHENVIVTTVFDEKNRDFYTREAKCIIDFIDNTKDDVLGNPNFQDLFVWEINLDYFFQLYSYFFINTTDYRDQLYKHVRSFLKNAALPMEECRLYLAKFFLKHVAVKRAPCFVSGEEEKERMRKINNENDLPALISYIEELINENEIDDQIPFANGRILKLKNDDRQKVDEILALMRESEEGRFYKALAGEQEPLSFKRKYFKYIIFSSAMSFCVGMLLFKYQSYIAKKLYAFRAKLI